MDPGAYLSQRRQASSIVLEPEVYLESVNDWSFTLKPFYRYDRSDPRRQHSDLREAYFLWYGDAGDSEWELRLGIDQVFWGVSEFNNIVDIIN